MLIFLTLDFMKITRSLNPKAGSWGACDPNILKFLVAGESKRESKSVECNTFSPIGPPIFIIHPDRVRPGELNDAVNRVVAALEQS